MTLNCLPASICSWDYCIKSGTETLAVLRFKSLSEQGSIEHNDHEIHIVKDGFMSGRWSLELHGDPLLTARRPSMFSRSCIITSNSEEYELIPRSLSRSYTIRCRDNEVARIEPVHLFTRRATIESDASLPTLVQLFAFWLVAVFWRRSQNSS